MAYVGTVCFVDANGEALGEAAPPRRVRVHDGPPRPRTAPRDRWTGIRAPTVRSRGAEPSFFVNKWPSIHATLLTGVPDRPAHAPLAAPAAGGSSSRPADARR